MQYKYKYKYISAVYEDNRASFFSWNIFFSKNRIRILLLLLLLSFIKKKKRTRMMKSIWDLLFLQRKPSSPLIIHTVASQQWNAVRLPYWVYPISEPLLWKQICLCLQHMKLTFFSSHRSLFYTSRVKWLSAKSTSQCNIAFLFKGITFFFFV